MAIIAPRKKLQDQQSPIVGGSPSGQTSTGKTGSEGTGFVNPQKYMEAMKPQREQFGEDIQGFLGEKRGAATSAAESALHSFEDSGGEFEYEKMIRDNPTAQNLYGNIKSQTAGSSIPSELTESDLWSDAQTKINEANRVGGYTDDYDQWANITREMSGPGQYTAGMGALDKQLMYSDPNIRETINEYGDVGDYKYDIQDILKDRYANTAKEEFNKINVGQMIADERQNRGDLNYNLPGMESGIDPMDYATISDVSAADVYTPEMRARRKALSDIAGLGGIDLEDIYAGEEYNPDQSYFDMDPAYQTRIDSMREMLAAQEANRITDYSQIEVDPASLGIPDFTPMETPFAPKPPEQQGITDRVASSFEALPPIMDFGGGGLENLGNAESKLRNFAGNVQNEGQDIIDKILSSVDPRELGRNISW